MKNIILALALAIAMPTAAWAQQTKLAGPKCSPGKITCAEWCGKYRQGQPRCYVGHPNSCEFRKGGNNSCVFDRAS